MNTNKNKQNEYAKNEKMYIRKKGKEFFNTAGLIEVYPNNQYYIIVGQRSNGKTYSTLKYLIDHYFETEEQFMYLRRLQENIKGNLMDTIFNDFQKYVAKEYGCNIQYYRQTFRLIPTDPEVEFKISECPIIGYCQSLTNTEKMKSTSYPDVTTIIFEEFIATMAYLPNEVNLLQQIISTVFRYRTNCKVILLGNTISKRNPYTEALGISIKNFDKGKTLVMESILGNVRTGIVLHRCNVDNESEEAKQIVTGFTAFGQTNYGTMINEGNFEARQGKRHIAGITFQQLTKHVPRNYAKDTSLKATSFYIAYLDEFYRIYMHRNGKNNIVGFMPTEGTDKKCKVLLSSNTDYTSKDYRLITNIQYNGLQEGKPIHKQLVDIVSAVKSGMMITFEDEDNENILQAFAEIGLNIDAEK